MEQKIESGILFTERQQAEICRRICALREEKKMSYELLSQLTGYSKSTVIRYFTGETKSPQFYVMASLVIALGGSLDEVLGLKPPETLPTDNPYQELVQAYQENVLYQREHIDKLEDNTRHALLSSRITLGLLVFVIVLVAGWLIYDITHPDRGWIQYAAEWVRGMLYAHL